MQLPEEFISSVRLFLGEETPHFGAALAANTPVSIRLNPAKHRRNPMAFSQNVEKVPWSEYGYYLGNRPAFTFDPLFHAGYYYVQEASSMFVEHVVRQLARRPSVCLDACAAPGGKSVALLSALPQGSLLVSNEIIRSRAHVLAETVQKFGSPHTVVTNNAPEDFAALPAFFDVVLVDAPCSGEGMFRKDETAVREWSPENVRMCADRQREILRGVWPSLKPGGLLVYSTCTFNTVENEENALWIARELGARFVAPDVDAEWGISPAVGGSEAVCFRFFPHKTRGEGLFVAVLQKNGKDDSPSVLHPRKPKNKPLSFLKDAAPYLPFLNRAHAYDFVEENNLVAALPKIHTEMLAVLREKLNPVSCGIGLGTKKGKDFIPSHALAMSTELNADAFPCCEIAPDEAIAYLRRETVFLPDAPKGFVLLTHKNEPLGFVKNIGNRTNNLYPQEWRIRSGYLPNDAMSFLTPVQQ